jgi:hypothetical protein
MSATNRVIRNDANPERSEIAVARDHCTMASEIISGAGAISADPAGLTRGGDDLLAAGGHRRKTGGHACDLSGRRSA